MAKQFPPLRGSSDSKSFLASKTIVGILVALGAKISGIGSDDLNDVVFNATAVWPIIVGLIADIGAMIARLREKDFDRTIFKRKDFWLQVVSGVMTIVAAFGYDLSALHGIIDKGMEVAPAIAALLGGILGIYGTLTARKAIRVPQTSLLPFLILAALTSTSHGQTPVDTCCAVRIRENVVTGVARLWSKNDKLWPQRSTLRVRFLNGTATEQSKAWREFTEIDSLVILKLVQVVAEPSDIRVQFDVSKGHWSYVGTDCTRIKSPQPTMNLGLRNLDFRGEWRRVAQHELLHALGFEHEHQSPNSTIPWNKEAVYAYYGQTQGWSRSQIKFQVLDRYTGGNWQGTTFDKGSIMQYPVPGELTNYRLSVGWNSRRSSSDDAELRRRYP
jgi:hypothetical protein